MPFHYATAEDLALSLPRGEQELIELTDATGTGSVDDDKIERALGHADTLIDTYLRGRYPVPVQPAPALLRDLACDVARHYLYGDAPGEHVKDRFKAAVSQLKDLSNGTAVLPGTAGDAAATPAGLGIRHGQARTGFAWERY